MLTIRERILAAALGLARTTLRKVRSRLVTRARIQNDDVRWAYLLLLDREPEDDRVVAEKLELLSSRRELRTAVLLSSEFRAANPEIAGFTEHCTVIKETTFGKRIFLDLKDLFICQAIAQDRYEQNETALVRRLVEPGQSVVDVGANVGYYTLLFASLVGESGHVHAFEPFPANAHLLEKSIAENSLSAVVSLRQKAIGDRAGTLRLISSIDTVNSGG